MKLLIEIAQYARSTRRIEKNDKAAQNLKKNQLAAGPVSGELCASAARSKAAAAHRAMGGLLE